MNLESFEMEGIYFLGFGILVVLTFLWLALFFILERMIKKSSESEVAKYGENDFGPIIFVLLFRWRQSKIKALKYISVTMMCILSIHIPIFIFLFLGVIIGYAPDIA